MVLQFLTYVCLSACLSTALSQFIKDDSGNTRFVAARKGEKPPCDVQPGQTFCEDVPNYPYEIILQAIKNTKFDITKFLVDETKDEGPDFSYLNHHLGLDHTNEKHHAWDGHSGPHDAFSLEDPFLHWQNKSMSSFDGTHPRPYHRGDFKRKDHPHDRVKRQSNDGLTPRAPLCRATLKYVHPKLAMSSRTGEWMYIVIMVGSENASTQMLKTEVCSPGVEGSPCMGDCASDNLPLQVISQCQQHYLQKRLVSLSPNSGNQVYTEMFWLPTCCICQTFQI